MHPSLKRLEHITDKSIPFLLVLLGIILVIEFFFKEIAKDFHNWIITADLIIILFFSIDLAFKYNRVRDTKYFLKKYWLDILAIFPFFLLFRLIEEVALIFRISPELTEGQKFLHIGLETEKIAREERALRELVELQRETKFARTARFARYFRIPRFIKIFPFYEKPIRNEMKSIKKKFKRKANRKK